MKRQILLTVSSKEFVAHTAKPLIADDTNAYEIVLQTPYDLTGAIFSITALRPDGVLVSDIGSVDGSTATYTIKNNMYSVAGETRFRLTLVKEDTSLTETELLCDVVLENGSPDLSGDDRVPALQALIEQAGTAIVGANQVASDLLAAKEAGEFDGVDGATGAQGPAGKWDMTTEYEELTTFDNTVLGAINELNGKNQATGGGAAYGYAADTDHGGALGSGAVARNGGGAVGLNAWTDGGFAGGNWAQCFDDANGDPIDAIQLGTGINFEVKTLKVYNSKIVNADGKLTQLESEKDNAYGVATTNGSNRVVQLPAALNTDPALAANSDTAIASQKATKAYVDNKIGDIQSVLDAVNGEVI